MPYNYKDFEVVQVAFPRESLVLAHLKEESARYKGRVVVGPHILELLTDRDAHLYGTAEGQGQGIWFPSNYQIVSAVKVASTQENQTTQHVERLTVIEEANVEDVDAQAAMLAASFDDDDW